MFSSNIKFEDIKRRINEFRHRVDSGIRDDECINEISLIFGDIYSFPCEMRNYAAETLFFRARLIENDDTRIPLRTINSIADAWEPPAEFVKVQGRLNSVGQGILYCCPDDPDLAIDEARARGYNHVAIIVYRSLRTVNVAVIGDYESSSFPKDQLSRIFWSFLEEEFGRDVPKGHEGRYSITRAVADTFFNYPEQDAWCYRSVQSPSKFNTAFLPGRSRQCLELSGVMVCDLSASLPGQLNVKCVVDFDSDTGAARYHPIGSDRQKSLFPEIN
jgi:hypothetical protein